MTLENHESNKQQQLQHEPQQDAFLQRLAIVGAGRLGTTLMMYWHQKGIQPHGVHSLHEEDAKRVAKLTGAKVHTDLLELVKENDFIWITVPDSAIAGTARQLADTIIAALKAGDLPPEALSRKLFCHTSGATPAKALEPLSDLGAKVMSIHPLQSFAGWQGAPHAGWTKALEDTWFFVEGDTDGWHMPWVETLMASMGNPWRTIKEEQKALYHASACVASNYLVTLLQEAKSLLDLCGDIPTEALMPLVRGTVDNFAAKGFEALTGPIARGDTATVEAHLVAMEAAGHDTTLYRMMAERTKGEMQKAHKVKEETL